MSGVQIPIPPPHTFCFFLFPWKSKCIKYRVHIKGDESSLVQERAIVDHRSIFFSQNCYDTSLDEVESPVITWVQALGSYLFVALGRRILGGKPGVFQRRTSLASISPCTKGIKLPLFIFKHTTHASTNEYRHYRQTCPGIPSVPPADLNITGRFYKMYLVPNKVFSEISGLQPIQYRTSCFRKCLVSSRRAFPKIQYFFSDMKHRSPCTCSRENERCKTIAPLCCANSTLAGTHLSCLLREIEEDTL